MSEEMKETKLVYKLTISILILLVISTLMYVFSNGASRDEQEIVKTHGKDNLSSPRLDKQVDSDFDQVVESEKPIPIVVKKIKDPKYGQGRPLRSYSVTVPEKPREVPKGLKGDYKSYWLISEDLRMSFAVLRAKAGTDMDEYNRLLRLHHKEINTLIAQQREIYRKIQKENEK